MNENANLDGTVITTRGLQLIAKLVGAEAQMEFTAVKVGTGHPEEGEDPSSLIHLVEYKMDGMIAEYGYDDETKDAYVTMQLTNTEIESGFVMTEIGVYARDPDLGEILYAYLDLSDDPNHIMPAETGRIKTVQMKLHVIVGEVTQITATVNPISQVTRGEFERRLKEIEEKYGRILFGPEETEIEDNDVLYILDDNAEEQPFEAASYNNVVFSATPPSGGQYWAQTEEDGKTVNILNGKLVVSDEEPTPPTDATFFGKSTN